MHAQAAMSKNTRLLWLLGGTLFFLGITWGLALFGKSVGGTREGALQLAVAYCFGTAVIAASLWRIARIAREVYAPAMLLLALTPLVGAALAPRPDAWIEMARDTGWFWLWFPLLLAMTPMRSCATEAGGTRPWHRALHVGAWPVAGLLLQIPAFLP